MSFESKEHYWVIVFEPSEASCPKAPQAPEGIENMRKSHVGNTKEGVCVKRMQREQEAIRNKLGMR